MRLVAGALALVLFAPFARAEDPTSGPARSVRPAEDSAHSKIPLRVVRILPESHQALLFDRARATHVLAEIGGQLDGYTVEDIDDDAVTLSRDGRQVVLAAPPHAGHRHRDAVHDRDAVQVRSAAARSSDTAEPAPVDPYDDAGEAGIRVVHAPDAPASRPVVAGGPVVAGEGGIRVVEAPGAAPAPAASAPAPAAVPTTSAPPAAAPGAPAGGAPDPGHIPAPEAASPGIRVVAAPGGPASAAPVAPVPALPPAAAPAAPVHPAPAVSSPEPRAAAAARAPERQTVDARALADVMTGDGGTRSPRPPTAEPQAAAIGHPATAALATPADAHPGDAMVISRGELDRALTDFAGLTAALRGRFSASGVTVESVGEGTIFQRAGLRAGDVITSVDGARLHTLDDAASLYARASTARAMTAQVLRGGKPVTLRVVIR